MNKEFAGFMYLVLTFSVLFRLAIFVLIIVLILALIKYLKK
ncbi:hypothetical protein [Peptoniphilus grossensis]|nr:hypothetical protein [Peptoniphilus grossensis]